MFPSDPAFLLYRMKSIQQVLCIMQGGLNVSFSFGFGTLRKILKAIQFLIQLVSIPLHHLSSSLSFHQNILRHLLGFTCHLLQINDISLEFKYTKKHLN